MKPDVFVSSSNLGTLLVCSVRYALGRSTYMPWQVCDIVRQHWAHIAPGDQAAILRTVTEALDNGQAGVGEDWRMWKQLVAEMTPSAEVAR